MTENNGNMILNKSCMCVDIPDGLMISDPPYNQGYHYSTYKDRLNRNEFLKLLSVFRRPCVVIGYPEMIINELTEVLGKVDEVVFWVYNSNTAKQSRLVAWYGCKPDFKKIGQPYKNPKDKRIARRISEGKKARSYDWWEINQVKNVSKSHSHPCPVPAELIKRIIVSTASVGQMIIDPFAGSGTTLLQAKELGHPYFGTEIDDKYYAEAFSRLTAQQG